MSNTIRTTLLATMLFSLGAVGANTARACEAPPPAVIDIDANSYYTDKNHSVIDPVRKARNEAATRPVDAFLEFVARNASAYQAAPEAAPSAKGGEAQCALQWLSAWAKGGAMLGRMSSNQSYYTRKWALGGLALSYAKLKPAADAGQRQLIEPWLKALAEGTVVHSDANKGVRNNHYYWEGLAVASVGAVTGDERFLAWGRKVFDHAMSQIAADGSLPLEMARASKALHYHSFAAEPLVMLASVLDVQSPKLDQLVRFTLQGIADPSGIEKATGITQERLRGTPSWKTVYDRHAAAAGTPVTSGTPNLWQPRMGGDLRLPNPLEHVVRQQS